MKCVPLASLTSLFADKRVVLAMWKDNPDEPVDWLSPGVAEFTGFAISEFAAGDVHIEDIIHPKDRLRWAGALEAVEESEVVSFEKLRVKRKDGEITQASVNVQACLVDGQRVFMAAFHDHSIIHELERELKQSEREHRRLLEHRSDELERLTEELQIEVNERQMAEKELRRTVNRFRAVLENAHNVAIQGFDRDGRVQYWNAASEKLYGISGEDAMGELIQDLLNMPAAEKREFLELLGAVNSGEALVSRDWRITLPSGKVLQVFSSMFPVNEDENVREVFRIDIDVTELRRATEQLRQSRQFLTDILNTIVDPVFVKDDQHRWILLNDSMCDFIGQRREDLIGKSDYDVFPKDEADVFWEKDSIVFETGEPNINVENFTDTDGELHIISTKKSLLVDPYNGRKTLVGIIRDITQSKRLEHELQEHRDNLQELVEERNEEMKRSNRELKNQYRFQQSLLDRMPHPVFYKDTRGVFLGCNSELAKVLGREKEEIIGSTVFDLQPRALAEAFHQHDMELLDTQTQDYESMVLCADGKERPFSISKSVFYSIDGNLAGFFGVMVDISKHKQHLHALQESYTKIEQAQDEIIRLEREASALAMAVTASHEINQPLMVLRGNMEMLRKSFKPKIRQLDEKQLHYWLRMEESMEEIRKILEKFHENNAIHFDNYAEQTDMVVFDKENEEQEE